MFLSSLRGLLVAWLFPTACAVDCILSLLHGCVFLRGLLCPVAIGFYSYGSLETTTIRINLASSFCQNTKAALSGCLMFFMDASYCAAGLRRTGAFFAAGAAGFEVSSRPFSITIMKGFEV